MQVPCERFLRFMAGEISDLDSRKCDSCGAAVAKVGYGTAKSPLPGSVEEEYRLEPFRSSAGINPS